MCMQKHTNSLQIIGLGDYTSQEVLTYPICKLETQKSWFVAHKPKSQKAVFLFQSESESPRTKSAEHRSKFMSNLNSGRIWPITHSSVQTHIVAYGSYHIFYRGLNLHVHLKGNPWPLKNWLNFLFTCLQFSNLLDINLKRKHPMKIVLESSWRNKKITEHDRIILLDRNKTFEDFGS